MEKFNKHPHGDTGAGIVVGAHEKKKFAEMNDFNKNTFEGIHIHKSSMADIVHGIVSKRNEK